MQFNDIDAEWLDLDQVRRFVPHLDVTTQACYPIVGGLLQRRGGTARHDAVAWGYARAASALGVDIIQGCEVQGLVSTRLGHLGMVLLRTGDARFEALVFRG